MGEIGPESLPDLIQELGVVLDVSRECVYDLHRDAVHGVHLGLALSDVSGEIGVAEEEELDHGQTHGQISCVAEQIR